MAFTRRRFLGVAAFAPLAFGAFQLPTRRKTRTWSKFAYIDNRGGHANSVQIELVATGLLPNERPTVVFYGIHRANIDIGPAPVGYDGHDGQTVFVADSQGKAYAKWRITHLPSALIRVDVTTGAYTADIKLNLRFLDPWTNSPFRNADLPVWSAEQIARWEAERARYLRARRLTGA